MLIIRGVVRQSAVVARKKYTDDKNAPDVFEDPFKVTVEHSTPNRSNPSFMDMEFIDLWFPLDQKTLCPPEFTQCEILVRPWSQTGSRDVGLSGIAFLPSPELSKADK